MKMEVAGYLAKLALSIIKTYAVGITLSLRCLIENNLKN